MSSKNSANIAIVWFRKDLRLSDNPALSEAVEAGYQVVPVYILDRDIGEIGAAQNWWLHHSLQSLQKDFAKHHVELILQQGKPLEILQTLVKKLSAKAIYWNRCYSPATIKRDKAIKAHFKDLEVHSFNSALLFEPWEIQNGSKEPFKVFTPFWRHCVTNHQPRSLYGIPKLTSTKDLNFPSDVLADWQLLPKDPDWASDFSKYWQVGESSAQTKIDEFIENDLTDYHTQRDIPAAKGTSEISPHLHFGEISPHQIWQKLHHWAGQGRHCKGFERYLTEIGWREFSHHLLYYHPELPNKSYREKFTKFPWHKDQKALKKWQQGLTGYPIIDAGMRQLWQTGWLHNRVRMVVASFLTKHLLISWQSGAEWFMYTLLDADQANNSAGWQWVAGSGADAAPYFRIFNPMTQGARFDPKGDYVRKWVPELADLPDKYIHQPWQADQETLEKAKIELGKTYPEPMVEHADARKQALAAFYSLSKD